MGNSLMPASTHRLNIPRRPASRLRPLHMTSPPSSHASLYSVCLAGCAVIVRDIMQALALTPRAYLGCFLAVMAAVLAARWALQQAVTRPRSNWLSMAMPFCYLLLWAAYWLPAMHASSDVLAPMRLSPGTAGVPMAFWSWQTLRRLAFLVLSCEHWLLRGKLELLALGGAGLTVCQQYRQKILQHAGDFGLWPLLACRAMACTIPALYQAGYKGSAGWRGRGGPGGRKPC